MVTGKQSIVVWQRNQKDSSKEQKSRSQEYSRHIEILVHGLVIISNEREGRNGTAE